MTEINGGEVLFTITCVSNTSTKYLYIVWDAEPNPFSFDTNKEVRQFIKDNCKELYEEHFNLLFKKLDDSSYYLDIGQIEPLGAFPWNKSTGHIVEQQIETYKPLIQLFIQDPKTYPIDKTGYRQSVKYS